MKQRLKLLLDKARNIENVIIVGAGVRGKELMEEFEKDSAISVVAFFDNNEELYGKEIKGKPIIPFENKGNDSYLYVLAVASKNIRREIYEQLLHLGIQKNSIAVYYHNRESEYLAQLDESYYKNEIDEMYEEIFEKKINWSNPVTYNEIINWEKINKQDERKTKLADKFLVRAWVRQQIGEQYLTQVYGVWDKIEEIDFEVLPKSFVLKTNHGSGYNMIIKDKSEINIQEIREQFNEWMGYNHAYSSLEFQYRDIIPKIICEEYLEGVAENIYDYDIFCFHGEPEYIQCIKGSHTPACCCAFYNKNWEIQPFTHAYPKDSVEAPKPNNLELMLELSRKLSESFSHVRIDWYDLPDGRILFGEMSFSTWSGLKKFIPDKYDRIFGELILK